VRDPVAWAKGEEAESSTTQQQLSFLALPSKDLMGLWNLLGAGIFPAVMKPSQFSQSNNDSWSQNPENRQSLHQR
jgi:hypothetical protein